MCIRDSLYRLIILLCHHITDTQDIALKSLCSLPLTQRRYNYVNVWVKKGMIWKKNGGSTVRSQTTTGHQMSQQWPEMPISGQIWLFLGKKSYFYWRNQKLCYPHNGEPTQAPCSHWFLVGHWTKCAKKMAKFGPKWPKMQILDQILAVFGPKILIFMGVSKSFGTNITENHLDNLSALFFGQFLDQMGQKCQYLAVFRPKIQFFGGR